MISPLIFTNFPFQASENPHTVEVSGPFFNCCAKMEKC
jgi:hypothetical protein